MIITKTPFRVSFCGGGSDMANFYEKYGGCVLSTSINKYCYISIHPYFNENQTLLKYSENELVDDIKDISKDDTNLLIDIYNLFAEYSAWGLRNLTHSETPWKSTKRNEVIKTDKMASTFKEKYLEA